MTTGREHAARLTEMAVRAQEAADWLAGQDDAPMADDLAKKDAHVERLLTDIRGLVQRAEAAERERDAAMQAHADDIAAKDAEIERLTRRAEFAYNALTATHRDTFQRAEDAERQRDQARGDADALAELLVKTADAIGGYPHTSDLPRLVRELRDERDRYQRMYEKAKEHHLKADRHARELERPGSTDAETASREPETPGFKPGDRVWSVRKSRTFTVHREQPGYGVICDDPQREGAYVVLEPADARHVYDPDHEPPEGVNVVRDMGDDAFARRTPSAPWSWSDRDGRDLHGAMSWVQIVAGSIGPLVEWWPGDNA